VKIKRSSNTGYDAGTAVTSSQWPGVSCTESACGPATQLGAFPPACCMSFHIHVAGLPSLSPVNSPTVTTSFNYDENGRVPSGVFGRGNNNNNNTFIFIPP